MKNRTVYVARILYPIHVLGPGARIGIWLAGCTHACPDCSNPELWERRPEWKTDTESVLRLIRSVSETHRVDGFTITGGDPLDQPEALRELLPALSVIAPDILLYTGYLWEALNASQKAAASLASVVIDGPYIREKNRGLALRGSENQRVIYNRESYRAVYETYMTAIPDTVENFPVQDGIISVGIHRKDYARALKEQLRKKGLEEA